MAVLETAEDVLRELSEELDGDRNRRLTVWRRPMRVWRRSARRLPSRAQRSCRCTRRIQEPRERKTGRRSEEVPRPAPPGCRPRGFAGMSGSAARGERSFKTRAAWTRAACPPRRPVSALHEAGRRLSPLFGRGADVFNSTTTRSRVEWTALQRMAGGGSAQHPFNPRAIPQLAGRGVPVAGAPWHRRTNVWRKVTSPRRKKKLRSQLQNWDGTVNYWVLRTDF
jgi:hypothetical protein